MAISKIKSDFYKANEGSNIKARFISNKTKILEGSRYEFTTKETFVVNVLLNRKDCAFTSLKLINSLYSKECKSHKGYFTDSEIITDACLKSVMTKTIKQALIGEGIAFKNSEGGIDSYFIEFVKTESGVFGLRLQQFKSDLTSIVEVSLEEQAEHKRIAELRKAAADLAEAEDSKEKEILQTASQLAVNE